MLNPKITAAALLLVGCSDSQPDFEISHTASGDESFVVINHEYLFFTAEEYPVLQEDYITTRMHDDYKHLLIDEEQQSHLDPQPQAKMERLAGYFYHNDQLWRLEQEILTQLEVVSPESGRDLQPDAQRALKQALATVYFAKKISDPERILDICSELRYCILSHNHERIQILFDQGFFDLDSASHSNSTEKAGGAKPYPR